MERYYFPQNKIIFIILVYFFFYLLVGLRYSVAHDNQINITKVCIGHL